ncbi:MAG: siroheme synthase CysG [Pseudomonadota bacterium]
MKHFPIFVALEDKHVVVSGGGEAAVAKLRLILKTEAVVTVFATNVDGEIEDWAAQGKLTLVRRDMQEGDTSDAVLFYAADEDEEKDARTSAIARADGALANIVDNLHDSEFITPAIVDRDPVTVAIGTEGAAPVLARAIKSDLEERLPSTLGALARIGKLFRKAADALPMGRVRRDFWSDYYFNKGPLAIERGGEEAVNHALDDLLERHLNKRAREGYVAFVGAGPGDPELLTLKARKSLHEADVVIYDRLVSGEILELARREAILINAGKEGFGPSTDQDEISAMIVEHAAQGAQVVRLKGGDPTVFGRLDEEIEAVADAGIGWHVVPGITAASASVAAIGQSLTKRGRNSSIRLVTGHDMKGFADHDWASLSRPGQVAAVYMGKKSSRFVQGRLLMYGADRYTPVSIIENASRPDQRIISSSLNTLVRDLEDAELKGPALMLIGLAPREATQLVPEIPKKLQERA